MDRRVQAGPNGVVPEILTIEKIRVTGACKRYPDSIADLKQPLIGPS